MSTEKKPEAAIGKLPGVQQTGLLVQCGRELAQSLMESAIETSTDSAMMSRQIFTLRRTSIHILATEAYNAIRQGKRSQTVYLSELLNDLMNEIRFLREDPTGEMIGLNPGENADEKAAAASAVEPDGSTTEEVDEHEGGISG